VFSCALFVEHAQTLRQEAVPGIQQCDHRARAARPALYGMEVGHFFRHEVLVLRARNNLAGRLPRFIKRAFDIVGSAMLMLLLSPVFAYIAWQVRKTGPGVFYGHSRVGENGKSFQCYKFRSMVPNADQVLQELLERDPAAREEWARDFKLKNDPRVTKIGAFLRKSSLDELPQLWNVSKGDMSLVEPRPITTAELERCGEDLEYYLEAKPGMTGLWYDILILLLTVRVVSGRAGAC
jgi:undecaprenyl-phosphate galactose phosphotransferase